MRLFIYIIPVLIIILFVGLWSLHEQRQKNQDPKKLAEDIVAVCTDTGDRAECYEEKIPALMDQGVPMNVAFMVTQEVQQLDETYEFCHVLAHYISEKEVAKDPSRWREVAFSVPVNICSGGAIHGAFQERFKISNMANESDKTIREIFADVCVRNESVFSDSVFAECRHALGHLLMYITDGEIDRSLGLCDQLITATESRFDRIMCYDGAFMQIYQPLEPEDFALIEGKEIETREESAEFCTSFTDDKHTACIIGRWPLFMDTLKSPATVGKICEPLSEQSDAHRFCQKGVFSVVLVMVADSNADRMATYCQMVADEWRSWCFTDAAVRFIAIDTSYGERALHMCSVAVSYSAGKECYEELAQYMNFIFSPNDPARTALCQAMPPIYQTQCQ